VGAKEQFGRTWSSFHLTRGTYINSYSCFLFLDNIFLTDLFMCKLSFFSQVTFYFAPTMLLPKKIGWYIQKSGLYDETVRRFAARISETGIALGTAMGTAV